MINLSLLSSILPEDSYNVLETRGGFHILVNTRVVPKNIKWHEGIRNLYEVDQVGDQLIPVPGCVQGGFIPRFVDV